MRSIVNRGLNRRFKTRGNSDKGTVENERSWAEVSFLALAFLISFSLDYRACRFQYLPFRSWLSTRSGAFARSLLPGRCRIMAPDQQTLTPMWKEVVKNPKRSRK